MPPTAVAETVLDNPVDAAVHLTATTDIIEQSWNYICSVSEWNINPSTAEIRFQKELEDLTSWATGATGALHALHSTDENARRMQSRCYVPSNFSISDLYNGTPVLAAARNNGGGTAVVSHACLQLVVRHSRAAVRRKLHSPR